MTDIVAAANAFKEAVKGNTVPPEEIQRRLSICQSCPKLRRVGGFTGRISQLMGAISDKHKVSIEFRDRSCQICGCSLLLLLPATKENLHVDSPEEKRLRPRRCWLLDAQGEVNP